MAIVGSGQIAAALGITRRRVEQLVDEGMPRAGHGKYDLGACLLWIAKKKLVGSTEVGSTEAGSFRAERSRAMRADASLKEIELAKRRGEVIEVDESVRIWEVAMERIRTKMIAAVNVNAPRIIGIKTVAQANAALEAIVYEALSAGASVGDEIKGDAVEPRSNGHAKRKK